MRSEIQAPGGNASLWHDLANWLALAALFALGIVWSPADAAQAQCTRIALAHARPRLTLVTCYPFGSFDYGGPLPWVVTADLLDAPQERG
jgi:hypothetical protein